VSPKACGHTEGRKVVSREDAVMHIKAAVDARNESGSDLVIVARTDSRQAISFEEALWRVQAFADVGADVLLIDALGSVEEMKAFCAVAPGIPKMVRLFYVSVAFLVTCQLHVGLWLFLHLSRSFSMKLIIIIVDFQ